MATTSFGFLVMLAQVNIPCYCNFSSYYIRCIMSFKKIEDTSFKLSFFNL